MVMRGTRNTTTNINKNFFIRCSQHHRHNLLWSPDANDTRREGDTQDRLPTFLMVHNVLFV